jgi:hypothetical protein
MDDQIMWHGRLILIACCLASTGATPPTDLGTVERVRSQQFNVHYQINDDARPLRSVSLWYTFDQGKTWQNFGEDGDTTPPIPFTAPREGLCGLLLIAENAAGASSPPPGADTEPQRWIFVDYTPPVGQIREPQLVSRGGNSRIVQLEWTAIDANLADRPIDLAYRVLPDGPWQDLDRRLPNTGRYDWQVPAEISADRKVMFRMTVRDRGGNAAESATGAMALATPPQPSTGANGNAPAAKFIDGGNPGRTPSPAEARRAEDLLKKGSWHQLRREDDLAVARFRDALRIDPRMTDALVKLGVSLYALGDYEQASGALDLALRQRPNDENALEEMAKTLVALKNYPAAESRLLAIVERDPNNIEAWLHLGDVAIYRGDQVSARDYYVKAATLKPDAGEIVARAKARLEDLPALTQRYRDAPSP